MSARFWNAASSRVRASTPSSSFFDQPALTAASAFFSAAARSAASVADGVIVSCTWCGLSSSASRRNFSNQPVFSFARSDA